MSLLRIPKGVFKLLVFVVVLAAGLVLAAVRTQGGRDFIATQIETAFARAFAGSLEIGRLHGNLLGTLEAVDVRLRDPDGKIVVSVDTLHARLSLLDLLRRDVTIRTATFVHPAVVAVRSDSGSWNVAHLFALRSPSTGDGPKWRFRSADVRVYHGTVRTVNEGALPEIVASGTMFDYTNGRYTDIHGRLTVGLGDGQRLFDVINLGGHAVDPDVRIETFNGQFVATDSTASLGAIRLTTAASEIELSGVASGFDGFNQFATGDSFEREMRLDLVARHIDSLEVASIFPAVHIPGTSITLRLHGPRGDLTIDELSASMGGSGLAASGSISGLPERADFDLTILDSSIDVAELAVLIPGAESDILTRIPSQRITGRFGGSLDLGGVDILTGMTLDASFQTESSLGVIDGVIGLAGGAVPELEYAVDLNFVDFRVGRLVPDLEESSVWNGTTSIEGSGIGLDELAASARLDLTQSSIRGLQFDELAATFSALGRSYRIDADGRGPAGRLSVSSSFDMREEAARVVGSIDLTRFQILNLLADDDIKGRTEFTASSQFSASGRTLEDLAGFASVVVDTVTFYSETDTVSLPSSRHRIDLSHESDRHTSLVLRGDVFEGELEGAYTFGPLARVAKLWLGAAGRTLRAQLDKKLHPPALPVAAVADAGAMHEREQEDVGTFLAAGGFEDGLDLSGGLRINRMLELNRLLPGLPEFAKDVSIRTAARLRVDELNIQVRLDADSIRSPGFELDGLRGEILISGGYDSILEDLVDSDIRLEARRVALGANEIHDAVLSFLYADRSGSLVLRSSDTVEDPLAVALDAELRVEPDRNEIVLSEVYSRRVDYRWEIRSDAAVDLYGDAILFRGFDLINRPADTAVEPQSISIDGIVSGHYSDTLTVRAEGVSLDEISELASFRDHVGGRLDASINIARTLERPELVGSVAVRNLSYVYRDVGDLTVTSTYSGEGEELFVDASITQPREVGRWMKGNEARVWGTISIPGPESAVPFGALDISVEAEEVDLFFFEVLFATDLQDVSGNASGTGIVRGDLSKPIFEAEMEVNDVAFLSPPFNLRFALDGPVTVDSLGFHLMDVALTDPTGGTGTVRGDVLFNDYRFFSFDISADLEEIQIMNVSRSEDLAFYGEVWVTASATLTGPLQRTLLRSTDAVTSPRSRLYLPVTEDIVESDQTFITFTDSTGAYEVKRRRTMLDARPVTEREFIDGMDMNFNITIPPESHVFLVFDALLGDVIEARGSGRVQFLRFEGEYSAFGTLTISSGHYLFTAGEVFQRRFLLDPGGTITWDGDAVDAALSIPATYRTRASLAGLPGQNPEDRVPIQVNMTVSGRLTTPDVGLRIALDVDRREGVVIPPGLESAFNREDLAVEYATSVLLTNTFLLTSSSEADPTGSADDLLFNSLSQLVSSQVNRFVSQALDLDVNVGVQQGRTDNAYDVVYGFALRLDEQGLVIRGEGLYETTTTASSSEGLQGEFVVEYRLTPKVGLELFFRRESDLYRAASTLGTSYGAGIVYQTDFANWKSFGHDNEPLKPEDPAEEEAERGPEQPAGGR